jgi:hypothetical protein
MFEDEQYKLAASCFNSAGDFGLSGWARGRHLTTVGQKSEAKVSLVW